MNFICFFPTFLSVAVRTLKTTCGTCIMFFLNRSNNPFLKRPRVNIFDFESPKLQLLSSALEPRCTCEWAWRGANKALFTKPGSGAGLGPKAGPGPAQWFSTGGGFGPRGYLTSNCPFGRCELGLGWRVSGFGAQGCY